MTILPEARTPLTEAQARGLAYWWGGAYCRAPVQPHAAPMHGVRLGGGTPALITCLEEAQRLENSRRPEDNPHVLTWDW